MKDAGGAADEQPVFESGRIQKTPRSWSADGRFLLFDASADARTTDVWVLPLDGDRKPVALLGTRFSEGQASFSPDDRWIAYVSDESGRNEVYVQPFRRPSDPSEPGGKWQVSKDGAVAPHWRRDGKELVFQSLAGTLMAADVTPGATFQVGAARLLITLPGASVGWDMTGDGKRFLIAASARPVEASPITVVLNWHGR